MLVLTRKLQQQIKIGDQITVTVLRVKGNTVRVGIQAPREVRVVRGELPKEEDAGAEPQAVTALAEGADDSAEAGEVVGGTVVAFRVKLERGEEGDEESTAGLKPGSLGMPVEMENQQAIPVAQGPGQPIPGAHLPLRRIHDRFGGAPLKRVIAACNTLAK